MFGGAAFLVTGLILCVVLGWPSVKALIHVFLAGSVRCDFEAGPEAITTFKNPRAQKIADELRELGFVPLGIKREWRPPMKPMKGICFVSEETKTFADIVNYEKDAFLYFYTPFQDGKVVLTMDTDRFAFPIETKTFIQSGAKVDGAGQLMVNHVERVNRFIDEGSAPYDIFDQKSRLEATLAYYRAPEVRIINRTIVRKCLFNIGVTLVFLILGAVWLFLSWSRYN
jgi:hypothetical protein